MDDYGASLAGSADESKSTSCPRGHWRPAEDERLRQLVEQYGAQNWNSIAEKLQGRSGTLSLSLSILDRRFRFFSGDNEI